uniref:Xrn1 helical domain-containing protein n=1 Tax=Arundo donax TaxID=35708 RepID=A0A0A9D8X5_ARUDO
MLKDALREKSDIFNSENPDEDKVKLGEPGWRERYYEDKFGARTPEQIEEIRRDVVSISEVSSVYCFYFSSAT